MKVPGAEAARAVSLCAPCSWVSPTGKTREAEVVLTAALSTCPASFLLEKQKGRKEREGGRETPPEKERGT